MFKKIPKKLVVFVLVNLVTFFTLFIIPRFLETENCITNNTKKNAVIVDKHYDDNTSMVNKNDYKIAFEESLGFFDNIPRIEWEILRNITLSRVNNENPLAPLQRRADPQAWYQNNWDPDFSCRHDTKIGVGDGGKWICDPIRLIRQSERRIEEEASLQQAKTYSNNVVRKAGCIVYSVGSNGDFRFEEGLAKFLIENSNYRNFKERNERNTIKINDICEIHTFDFTDYGHKITDPNLNIHFHNWGLKPSYTETSKGITDMHFRTITDGLAFGQPNAIFKTYQETVVELGHVNKPIDILKIDCEGCEWGTYKDWIKTDIRQILVEVHRVPEIANDFFLDLQKKGFVTYHKEPNIQWAGGGCVEYAMLKLNTSFVEDRLNA